MQYMILLIASGYVGKSLLKSSFYIICFYRRGLPGMVDC